ncbi:AAA family ATPase [Pseudomonas aeruginosa]|nr:AAA family ATPase [Pseudomonas aeruginosa]
MEARVEQPVARAQRGNHHPGPAALLAPLVEKYNNNPGVCAYLQAMQLNLLKTVVDQLVDDSRTDAQRKQGLIEQYAPNQAIVHHATSGAPVVFESHPTYDNLFGRIEYSSDQGRSTPATGSCVRGRCTGPTAAS